MDRHDSTGRSVLELMLLDESAEPTPLRLSLLEEITHGFSDEQQIGNGGFSVVYKGMLGNGTVAVKKLSDTYMDEKQFHREIECLMKAKHKNVVRFLGYCADTQGQMERYNGKLVMADVRRRLLCFEYLPKGSLHDYITDASCKPEWRKCYKIFEGICNGLHYLHQNQILHLDLKPANILMDDNMVPKIADFGISRCFDENQTHITATRVGGTLGYMAPEIYDGKLTVKSDIYSLGAIIRKILTGATGYPDYENVLEIWRDRLEQPQVEAQLEQVGVCTKIGIQCMHYNPVERPAMQQIINMLHELESKDVSSSSSVQVISLTAVHLHFYFCFSELVDEGREIHPISGSKVHVRYQKRRSQLPIKHSMQKIVIKVNMAGDKDRAKAMKIMATIAGVDSVSITGDGRDRLEVVGDGLDPAYVVSRLRRNIGHASVISVQGVK